MNLYTILKDEIKDLDTKNSRLLLLLVTSTGLILTLGFDNHEAAERQFVFLCTYAFMLPIYWIMIDNRKGIWKASTYMRVFIEPKLEEVKWETRLNDLMRLFSEKEKRRYSSSISRNEFSLLNALNLITIVAMALNFLQGYYVANCRMNQPETGSLISYLAPSVIAIVIFVYLFFDSRSMEKKIRRSGDDEQVYFKRWKELKAKERYPPVH